LRLAAFVALDFVAALVTCLVALPGAARAAGVGAALSLPFPPLLAGTIALALRLFFAGTGGPTVGLFIALTSSLIMQFRPARGIALPRTERVELDEGILRLWPRQQRPGHEE